MNIKQLTSYVAARWRPLSEQPILGKLILLKANDDIDETNFTFSENKRIFKTYNCVPNDLTKYRVSIGFLQKTNKKNEFEFVMCDYMYDSNYRTNAYYDHSYDHSLESNKKDMIAPFSTIFFEKWIYLEEIINL